MEKRAVPMIHVPDVRATVEWYNSIGFEVVAGMAVEISIKEGRLYVTPPGQQPMSLWPLDQRTFKPVAIAGAKITFNVEQGSITFIQAEFSMELNRT